MDEKQFEVITKKLDSLTRLLAFNIIKDKSVSEQIDLLTKAGLKASEIAVLLGKTENQVYVTQTKLRKRKNEESKEQTSEQQTTTLEEQQDV